MVSFPSCKNPIKPNCVFFFPDEVKTLMFFEGCPPYLGCSIKLRGASLYELSRVKEIIRLMVCVAYHSQLEISFLMDEFAMPPNLSQSSSFPCLLEASSQDVNQTDDGGKDKHGEAEDARASSRTEEGASSVVDDDANAQDRRQPKSQSSTEEVCQAETMTSSPYASPQAQFEPLCPPPLTEEDQNVSLDPLISALEGESEDKEAVASVEDGDSGEPVTPRFFPDPLQDDTGMFVAEQAASSDDHLKFISSVFKQELKDIILCISPFITFDKPFLLTPAGMHCPSRDYFPEQVMNFSAFTQSFPENQSKRISDLFNQSINFLLYRAKSHPDDVSERLHK